MNIYMLEYMFSSQASGFSNVVSPIDNDTRHIFKIYIFLISYIEEFHNKYTLQNIPNWAPIFL